MTNTNTVKDGFKAGVHFTGIEWLTAYAHSPNNSFYDIAVSQLTGDELEVFTTGVVAIEAQDPFVRRHFEEQFVRLAAGTDDNNNNNE